MPNARMLAIVAGAAWACALPQNNAPPDVDAGAGAVGGTGNPTGGSDSGGSATGGSDSGGTTTGGSSTGGSDTGGSTTGGSDTGGSNTGGSDTGGSTTGGSAGSMAGSGGGGMGGSGGSAGSMAGTTAAGTGGTMAGSGGAMAGSGGTGGGPNAAGLVHRYAFDGTNSTAVDSIGNRNGLLINATQSGGSVNLAGGTSDQYVDLPPGMISALSNATFEAWVTWTGGTSDWQRVFDFGSNDGATGSQGSTNSTSPYLFFTPRATATTSSPNCTNNTASMPRVAFTTSGPSNEACVFGSASFPSGMTHLAATVSGTTLRLYIGGAPVGSAATMSAPLNQLSDSYNWLGRSQFANDTEFAGQIHEFRIYNVARSASQIAASATAGPDSPPTQ